MNKVIKNNGVKVELVGEIYENKKDCLWYGGTVAKISYKDAEMILAAIGDVRGDVFKDGKHLASFKDKRNNGEFAHTIASYIPEIDTDEKLKECLNRDSIADDTKKEKSIEIRLENNNWWEVIIYHNGECIDGYVIDCTDNLDEAIEHTIENIDYIYNEYCNDI